jgi:HAD superfamily hydrolase (TIGR01549 family)
VTDAVVFDLDGTLVDIPIDYEKLFAEFKTIMRTENIRPLAEVISKTDAATRETLFETWEKAELDVLNQVSVKAEGSKIYQAHKSKRKALVTLQGRAIANAILSRFNLSFEVIVTREDSLFRTAQLMKATRQLEVSMLNVLFVGNTEGDAAAASEVGCAFLKVE